MIVRSVRPCLLALALFFASFAATPARAGGDGPEAMVMDNMCMVMFGYDMIHITAYEAEGARDQYCDHIPIVGRIIFTFDIANPDFRDLPLELRIIRDPLTPISANTDLEPLTIIHLPPKLYRTGTFNFEHKFTEKGHFIGYVTLTRANGEKETQQFKFMVGQTLWSFVPQALGVVLIALMVGAYWRHSHTKPKAADPADALKSS
ncbi:hypothetical protein A1351_04725 [Methylosinus sp. R-45379]|nr:MULTISPECIES: hypothetical protein [unclassified Methylosinus]OAI31582.1 hypothetical protein A1351_04725 [Methylosinus sp. R-45379]TDX63859.1 hypothetical protein EDE12_1061 [Methylosinus sp. sav-2]